jgi:hypothetical protein
MHQNDAYHLRWTTTPTTRALASPSACPPKSATGFSTSPPPNIDPLPGICDEAERIIHVFTAPELQGEPPGTLVREAGETEDRYTRRAETLRTLLGGH